MINLGVLGNGTVGSGVVELIEKNVEYIKKRTGKEIFLSKILVKNPEKHFESDHKNIITNDINEFYDEKINMIVEVMGGLHPAYEYIKDFLNMKKHVVTANKDVVAKYGEELSSIAEKNGVSFRFEASVAGGIPIIKPLQECLAGNNISDIRAILNGTTNFILSKMFNENLEYNEALKEAQRLGFAEANPEADVMGYDAARKLAILSSISYYEKVDWESILTEGITEIDEVDIQIAKKLNCKIKLLAVSSKETEGVYAAVRPSFVSKHGYIGKVNDEFNGILVEGDAVGEVFFLGKGAGKLPTASAVLGDILNVLENNNQRSMFVSTAPRPIITKWKKKAQWIIRLHGQSKDKLRALVREYFKEVCEVHCELPEVYAAVVHAENEEYIDAIIDKLKNFKEVEKVKAFIRFDGI
jgi:homoserine dehydrogenase